MTKPQNRTDCTLNLLNELDSVCLENEIAYITGGIVIRAIFEKKALVFPCLDIYVKGSDLIVLRNKIIESSGSDRVIEDNNDNEGFHYVDVNTVFIDSFNMSGHRELGIHLNVIPFKEENSIFISLDASSEEKSCTVDYISNITQTEYKGTKINHPQGIESWYKYLFDHDGEMVFPGYPNSRCLVSVNVSYKDIIDGTDDFDDLAREMYERKTVIDKKSQMIDNRMQIIDNVMDKVRKTVNDNENKQL